MVAACKDDDPTGGNPVTVRLVTEVTLLRESSEVKALVGQGAKLGVGLTREGVQARGP